MRQVIIAVMASLLLWSCVPSTEDTDDIAGDIATTLVVETAEADAKFSQSLQQTEIATSTSAATGTVPAAPTQASVPTFTESWTSTPTSTSTAYPTPKATQNTIATAIPTGDVEVVEDSVSVGQINVLLGNLRSGPGTEYDVVTQLPTGTELDYMGRSNDSEWFKVSVTSTGEIGWVSQIIVELDFEIDTLDEVVEIPPLPTAALTQSPEPTVTTAPVVSGSTQFSLGGQVIHGGLLAIDKMQAMKMSWVKLQNYDLGGATVEGDIQNAHNNGLKILVSIKDNAGHTRIASPDYQEQFIQYLERVATLGADAIEVWNEPNLDREWPADQMGGANYTELLKKAYPRIKAANPNTMVISAALSPTGAFSGGCGSIGSVYGCDDKPFLQDMVNAGALNYLDCVGMHYNEGLLAPSATSGDPRGNSGHYTRYFRGMLDTYGAILGGARSICLTEIGYLSGEEWGYLPSAFSWNPASPVNMSVAQHADYLGQAVTLARQTGNIRLMIIFNVDFAILKSMEDDPQAGYSLIRPNQSCPACSTISAAMP